jgi:hypothetical protein
MKILALASVVALCAAPRVAPTAMPAPHATCVESALASARDDDPPPVECPMCGGNAELHRQRTKYFVNVRASALLVMLTTY